MDIIKDRRNVVIGNVWQGFGRLFELIRKIGLAGAIGYAVKVRALAALQLLGWDSKGKHILLKTRDAHYPVYARQSTSDLEVFEQIFVHKEYSALDDMKNPKVIVDCGAYVGYSTAYFLNKFPDSRIVAIEADGDDFVVCKLNLSPYEHRVTLLHSAIWSRRGGLVAALSQYDYDLSRSGELTICRNLTRKIMPQMEAN